MGYEIHASTAIAGSANDVFRVLTDLRRHAEWNPVLREVRGDLDVGGTIRVRVRTRLGALVNLEAEVLANEPDRELRIRGRVFAPWLVTGEHSFLVEPLGDGRVRFVQRASFGGVLEGLVARALAQETRRALEAMNAALKERVEHKSSWMLVETDARPTFGSRIEAIGAKVPERRVTTSELMATTAHRTGIDLERLTGIRERHVCGPGEDSLTLAIGAARDCLARSRYRADELDMIINASITRHDGVAQHRFEPPLSLSIKEAIGAHDATNFDISNACAGMLTGVFLLNDSIRRGVIRRGMVVSGEHITGLGENAAKHVRSVLSLELASLTLGDAGAAVIVDGTPVERASIGVAGFTTLAEHSRLCIGLPAWHDRGARMFTRARRIHEVAMEDGPPLLEELLEGHGIRLGEIDWFLPHQTSVRAVLGGERALADRLGEHPKHVIVTVDEYGNTASTTLFLALHHHLSERKFARGDRILLLSVASGLEIGVVTLVMDELEETHGHVH